MEFTIDERYADARVDRFLRKLLPDTALTEIFKGIRTGNIKVNGKKTKENARLNLGDVVKIFRVPGTEELEKNYLANQKQIENSSINFSKFEFIKLSDRQRNEIEKSIVFQDEKLIIINKKANLVMHVGSGHDYGLTEMVQAYLQNPDFSFVNRIDKATSGMVIGAKTLPAARELAKEIREGRIDKRYFILVEGSVREKQFSKTTFLKKIEDRVIELNRFEPGAKESTSHFKLLENRGNFSLIEGALDSGRTHQLRVQLSSMKHPIVGDYKYGAKVKAKRMMLHSYYLEIPRYKLKLELPIPDDFKI